VLLLTIALAAIMLGLTALVAIVPARTLRREGRMREEERARVLLGDEAAPDPPDV